MIASASVGLVDADAMSNEDVQRFLGWLSTAEAARYQRFVRAQRQRQFVIGRALLRVALGHLLNVAPQDVQFEEQTGKAPRLIAPVSTHGLPGFSISHSGRWVACAVSTQTLLGLDIEMKAAGRDLEALALQAFDAAALARWNRLPPLQRLDGFYALWSELEARFKLGLNGAGHCVALPHPELSVVVCSAVPLAPVSIEMVTLA